MVYRFNKKTGCLVSHHSKISCWMHSTASLLSLNASSVVCYVQRAVQAMQFILITWRFLQPQNAFFWANTLYSCNCSGTGCVLQQVSSCAKTASMLITCICSRISGSASVRLLKLDSHVCSPARQQLQYCCTCSILTKSACSVCTR